MEISSEQLLSTDQYSKTTPQKESGFGFFDFLDMVNPLQHIPIISTLYRNITGDEMKPISRIVGGAVFGGPVGGSIGIINTLVEHETGNDLLGNVSYAAFGSNPKPVEIEPEIMAYNDLPVDIRAHAQLPHTNSARYNS